MGMMVKKNCLRKKPSRFSDRKIVFVGDPYCGKTFLVSGFLKQRNTVDQQNIPDRYYPTIFDEYTGDLLVNNSKYNLSIHDTAGIDAYDRLRPLSYPDTDVIVLCFSVDNPDSLHNVVERWLPEIGLFCPNVPYILVGTKTDSRTDTDVISRLKRIRQHPVAKTEAKDVAKRIKALRYLECSAFSNDNVEKVFEAAIKVTIKKSKKELLVSGGKFVFRFLVRHIRSVKHLKQRLKKQRSLTNEETALIM